MMNQLKLGAIFPMINLKFLSYIAALLVVFAATPAVADHFRIRDCPDSAQADLNWAVNFINRHLDSILATQSILNTRYQASIKDDWPDTTIDCAKPSRNSCEDGANAFHAGANIVHLCWDNIMNRSGWNRCSVVRTILHEKAHEARAPIADTHEWTDLEGRNDPVYRFGESVFVYCDRVAGLAAAGTFDSLGLEPLGATAELPLGDYCEEDNQCQSNECRRGKCVCNDNGDCPAGYRCKTGGLNECIKIEGEIGEVCNRNSDCETAQCDRDICVCDTDQHCRDFFPGSDWRCRRGGQNACVRTNLPDGERCHVDGDCASGQCRGVGDGRTCRPTGLPNGARCEKNGDCASGQCRGIGSGRTCR